MLHWIYTHVPPWVWITLVAHGVVLLTVAYLILAERKIASWVQDRIGPNRVGPWGLLQPIADGLKFILKEDYRPAHVDRILFTIAPAIMIAVIIVSIAVIPWGGIKQGTATIAPGQSPESVIPAGARIVSANGDSVTYRWDFQIARLNIGVLFVLATLSLAVYGVVVGGWASNNKFSFLGGLRATANMISYEIPLSLAVLAIVVMAGSLDLGKIVTNQAAYWHVLGIPLIPRWNVFCQPLAFVLFLVCIHAEANRAPFDLAEAEQELVGGYHTEYSSMRFALFFLAEYAGMITTSCVLVALFFGGWHIPWLDQIPAFSRNVEGAGPSVTTSLFVCIARAMVFYIKAIGVLFAFMWVRWSLPRFRFDQLMDIAWRGLIPISLALLIGTTLIVYWRGGVTFWSVDAGTAILLLCMNAVVVFVSMAAAILLPAPPDTNRRIRVKGSRFDSAPDELAGVGTN